MQYTIYKRINKDNGKQSSKGAARTGAGEAAAAPDLGQAGEHRRAVDQHRPAAHKKETHFRAK